MRSTAAVLLLVFVTLWFAGCEDDTKGPTTPGAPGDGSVRVERVDIVSEPATGSTYLTGEDIVFGVWVSSGEAVEAEGDVFLVFDIGLAREPAALTDTEGDWLEFRYRIRRGDYDSDGISVPAGELMLSTGASVQIGGIALEPELPELAPLSEHRVFGRYDPGESLMFDETLDGFPLDSLGLPGAGGCATAEDFVPIVEAVLDGNLPGAGTLWGAAFATGRCAVLVEGEPAIFLSAEVSGEEDAIYDLVLAYGPGETVGGDVVLANWWTLADFLTEP